MNWRHTHAIYFWEDTDETDFIYDLTKETGVSNVLSFPFIFTEYKILGAPDHT